MNGLIWKRVEARRESGGDFMLFAPLYRAKVPGGWLILYEDAKKGGVSFYPDPEHKWDGNSLPDPEHEWDGNSLLDPEHEWNGNSLSWSSKVSGTDDKK